MEEIEDYLGYAASPYLKDIEYDLNYADKDLLFFESIKVLSEPDMTRLNMNLIAFCHRGKAEFKFNGCKNLITSNQILLCPSHTTISDIMMSPDCEFKILMISDRMLQSILKDKMHVWTDLVYKHCVNLISIDSPAEQLYMLKMSNSAKNVMHIPNPSVFDIDIRHSILRACFLSVCGIIIGKFPSEDNGRTQSFSSQEILFRKFIDLLQRSKVKRHSVEYYSRKLCISSKYLSVICRNHSGKNASEWITEYLLEDIRYYLKETDYSIKEVYNILGFSNQSFFGKYVKQHFGMTPRGVRNGNKTTYK